MTATARETTPWAAAAKAIRADLAAAVKAGTISIPDGAKLRVRTETASMMKSVDVRVEGPTVEAWAYSHDPDNGRSAATTASKTAQKLIEDVVARHWKTRYDGGPFYAYSDVTFGA
jgi:hypothetical protein